MPRRGVRSRQKPPAKGAAGGDDDEGKKVQVTIESSDPAGNARVPVCASLHEAAAPPMSSAAHRDRYSPKTAASLPFEIATIRESLAREAQLRENAEARDQTVVTASSIPVDVQLSELQQQLARELDLRLTAESERDQAMTLLKTVQGQFDDLDAQTNALKHELRELKAKNAALTAELANSGTKAAEIIAGYDAKVLEAHEQLASLKNTIKAPPVPRLPLHGLRSPDVSATGVDGCNSNNSSSLVVRDVSFLTPRLAPVRNKIDETRRDIEQYLRELESPVVKPRAPRVRFSDEYESPRVEG